MVKPCPWVHDDNHVGTGRGARDAQEGQSPGHCDVRRDWNHAACTATGKTMERGLLDYPSPTSSDSGWGTWRRSWSSKGSSLRMTTAEGMGRVKAERVR